MLVPRVAVYLVGALVYVRVAVAAAVVAVEVGVDLGAPPAHDQPDGQRHDHHSDRHLRRLLYAGGQVVPEQDDRNSEGDQRRRVAEAPAEAECSGATGALITLGGDERGDRGQVIRVRRVP